MVSPAVANCPECGAPVKSGDKQCWMCYRLLEWDGTAVKVTPTSPFAERPQQLPRTYYRTNPWAIVGLVLAALAMVPAVFVTFCITCIAAFSSAQGQGQAAGAAIFPVSIGAALIVFVGFCVLIGMLGTRISRPVKI